MLEWLWKGKGGNQKERSPARLAALLGKNRWTIYRELEREITTRQRSWDWADIPYSTKGILFAVTEADLPVAGGGGKRAGKIPHTAGLEPQSGNSPAPSRSCSNPLPPKGREFSDYPGLEHSCLTAGKRFSLFFTHPYRASERRTNEHAKGMIRRFFFPKGVRTFPRFLTSRQLGRQAMKGSIRCPMKIVTPVPPT